MYTRQLFSMEQPGLAEWGEKVHVPINIQESQIEVEGEMKTCYYYDLVERVVRPITVDSILDAIIDSEFTREEIAYIMRNFAKEQDPLVERYKALIEEVTPKAENCPFLEDDGQQEE